MSFKVGDRILHNNSQFKGTVQSVNGDEMEVLFDGDRENTLCCNDKEYFTLLLRGPTAEEKSEWASMWDDSAEDT